MISDEHKFILITPGKTGSVTLCDFFMKYTQTEIIQNNGRDCFEIADTFGRGTKHIGITAMCKKWDNKYDMDSYIKIGSIRNPWDRIVSRYFWGVPDRSYDTFSADDFLKKTIVLKMMNCIDKFTDVETNIMMVDSFIRFESMQQDVDTVCDLIGISKGILPHRNKSIHKPYWEYYNSEAKEWVEEHFKADIDYFGYKFGE